MSFPRYPEYKDSGVDWLGEVPKHWRLPPLWSLFRRSKTTGCETEELLSVYRDYGVIPKASRDDNNNKPSDDLGAYQLVIPGDLVINKMKAWQGSVAVSDHRGIVSPAYYVYKAHHTEVSRYLHYLMRSPRYVTGYLSLSKGIRVGQWDLEPQYHSRMPVVLPPKAEQRTIATFLDHETAKIDALVAEQEKLISLIAEKRQVVISNAVTKGLNPNALMKDSGIEWLGEVPAHWIVKPLRYLAVVETGSKDTVDAVDDGVYPFFVRSETVERINTYTFDSEAVLTAGDGAGVGKVFHYFHGKFDAHQRVYVLHSFVEVSARFMYFYLRELFYRVALEGVAKSTVDSLRRPMFQSFLVAVPPSDEQRDIVKFIENAELQYLGLVHEAELSIALLKERRAALISAAVTGTIDVRRLVQREPELTATPACA